MKNCPKCGFPLDNDDAFCPNCGIKIEKSNHINSNLNSTNNHSDFSTKIKRVSTRKSSKPHLYNNSQLKHLKKQLNKRKVIPIVIILLILIPIFMFSPWGKQVYGKHIVNQYISSDYADVRVESSNKLLAVNLNANGIKELQKELLSVMSSDDPDSYIQLEKCGLEIDKQLSSSNLFGSDWNVEITDQKGNELYSFSNNREYKRIQETGLYQDAVEEEECKTFINNLVSLIPKFY